MFFFFFYLHFLTNSLNKMCLAVFFFFFMHGYYRVQCTSTYAKNIKYLEDNGTVKLL